MSVEDHRPLLKIAPPAAMTLPALTAATPC